jgi:hypothetical protein
MIDILAVILPAAAAFAFTALLAGLLTPFGWRVLVGAALLIMVIQLIGGRGRMWPKPHGH